MENRSILPLLPWLRARLHPFRCRLLHPLPPCLQLSPPSSLIVAVSSANHPQVTRHGKPKDWITIFHSALRLPPRIFSSMPPTSRQPTSIDFLFLCPTPP